MSMTRRFLCILLILALVGTALLSCAPEGSPDSTDTAAGTEAPVTTGQAPAATLPPSVESADTQPADGPAETQPAAPPEVLVAAPSPLEVLGDAAAGLTPVPISTVCHQLTLTDREHGEVHNAFLEAGYLSTDTTPAHGTRLTTTVLRSLGHTVTLMATAEGLLHVLWEEADRVSTAPLLAPRAPAEGEVTMAQIGVAREKETDNPMIGMCYVYRLSDGTALILDGGTSNAACADNLFRTLERLDIATDGEGRYRIAAWIFTHGHGDHYGAFMSFTSRYASRVSLAYAMYSFPTGSAASGGDSEAPLASTLYKFYPDARRISPHAGLQYFFGNLTVHVLYAPELLYTTTGVDYYNNTSLILRMEANGQSVLHMGDAGEAAAEAAWSQNEEAAFLSTALQITHHGLTTGRDSSHAWSFIRRVYRATEAKLGLLPMGTREPGDARNGRHTVLVGWGNAGYHVSFVIDKRDNHGGAALDQAYYDRFVAEVAAGTAERDTLFGYDGVNTVRNRSDMLTYISASETEPMVTVFSLTASGMTATANEKLATWLGE